jgi:hypothetical protein
MRTVTIRRILAVVVSLVVPAFSPLLAQDWSALRKDPEVQNYELTMEKIHKLVEVQRGLSSVQASDPEVLPSIDREFKAIQKGNTNPTVADAAALVDRHANVRNVLSKAGMTSRDWLLTAEAVTNASLEMMLRGRTQGSAVAPATAAQKANVALLEKNQAEWQKLQQELRRLSTESSAKAKS